MRWVDIDKLEEIHPDLDDWEARANKVLNDLRKEVENAESDANQAGLDIASARKKAITEGLKKNHVRIFGVNSLLI
jgi:F0F1-type ATP synthase membrane subunit b/b'